jgi:DNA mismatch endonuclease (patch repair protein)
MGRPKRRDPAITSRMMAAVRNKDSKAELVLRKALWARGLRYRKHVRMTGKPDLVFGPARVAVFVDGDFWHGNAWRLRNLPNMAAMFPHRTAWWIGKIKRNIERDAEVNSALQRTGWKVLRFWESDILRNPMRIAVEIETTLRQRRRSRLRLSGAPR